MRAPLLIFALLHAATALRVAFNVSTRAILVPIQDFGAARGSLNVSLALRPVPACGANSSCWEELDHVYVAVLSYAQWQNLTLRTIDGIRMRRDIRLDHACTTRAMAWTAVSSLAWREAATTDDAGAACLGPGGDDPDAADPLLADASRELPGGGSLPHDDALRFELRYALPAAHDLYTVVLYNCDGGPGGAEVWYSGEARFLGGNGEHLSTRDFDVLLVRICLTLAQLIGAFILFVMTRVNRAYSVLHTRRCALLPAPSLLSRVRY